MQKQTEKGGQMKRCTRLLTEREEAGGSDRERPNCLISPRRQQLNVRSSSPFFLQTINPPHTTLSQPLCSAAAQAAIQSKDTRFKSLRWSRQRNWYRDEEKRSVSALECARRGLEEGAGDRRETATANKHIPKKAWEFSQAGLLRSSRPHGEAPKINNKLSIHQLLNAAWQALNTNNAVFWGLDVNLKTEYS